ncbi:hypothetical protein CHLNCDRAFT_145558 [Chlorella variabilis]|uniref:FAS1 domain-containing protein n=1 Tax=Chlorella variabilis TaxID=554065 RepID=E1ZDR3_CHLVA|nr:hypothetical protein CHLNCDRAFT_145558 [Chlorella variabilis]EFN55905.1 hypothetical protein CHLNCDRAFT_145558 [Chlorella variabilis]|eukprot:XP_005848007.1 hypothetical protein CHLNCDRAFT_145558 [Chlorella variabilis]
MMRCSIAVALVALLAVSAEAAKPPTVLAAVLASPDLSLLVAAEKADDPAVAQLLGSKAFGGTWIQTLVKGHPGVLKITKKKVVRLYTTSGGSALVVKADIKAGKAVVHKINRVLVPGKKVWWPKAKVIT